MGRQHDEHRSYNDERNLQQRFSKRTFASDGNRINGSFVIGSRDSMTNHDAEGFIRKINSYTQNPDANRIKIIDGASHIFYGMHEEYAKVVLEIVKSSV